MILTRVFDKTMINLLPPKEKEILFQQQSKRMTAILGIEALVFLVCLFFVLLFVKSYITGQVDSQRLVLQQVEKENQSSDFINYKDIVEGYNKTLSTAGDFYQKRIYISSALDTLFLVVKPKGIYFTNLLIESDEQNNIAKINLSGFSSTREDLLTFKNNIEAEKKIKSSYFAPECWISSKDIAFNVILEILKDEQQ